MRLRPLLLALLVGLPWPLPTPAPDPADVVLPLSGPVLDAPGSLLYATLGGLYLFEPATKAKTQLIALPQGALPMTPAASPDGSLIAFSLFQYGAGSPGTSLYLVGRDGSGQQLLAAHDTSLGSVAEAAWAPDGSALYVMHRPGDGQPRIDRISVDGADRTTVVGLGNAPTVSADGTLLAFVRTRGSVQDIWVANADGSDERQVVGVTDWDAVGTPRFTPDSERLIFIGVGGPGTRQAARPGIVYAHGVPWDIWSVRTDGSEVRRLTAIGEDYPSLAWSPDGRWIAFSGELGLYLVRPDGSELVRISDDWVSGGLTWLP
jgi:Tol biopolymer transport system component